MPRVHDPKNEECLYQHENAGGGWIETCVCPPTIQHEECERLGDSKDICACCPCGCEIKLTDKHYSCFHGQKCSEADCPQEKQDWETDFWLKHESGYFKAQVEGMTECHSPARIVAFIRTLLQEAKDEGRREGQLDPRSKTVINARLEVIAEVEKLVEENKFNDSWGVDAIYVDIFLGKLRSLKTNLK